MRKRFLPSLAVDSLLGARGLQQDNIELLRSKPVLILVTGEWAQHVSIDAYHRLEGRVYRLPSEPYDHFERLGAAAKPAESSELSKAYRVLEYHSSVCTYERGEGHEWRAQGVSPMLSDMVILPRLLTDRRIGPVMHAFVRAVKKTLRDSLLLAGGARFKEDTWEKKAMSVGDTTQ